MMISCFGFLLSVLFIPGISGAGTTPRWALAAVMLPLLIWSQHEKEHHNLTAAHLCGMIFIWYAAISVTWSPQHWDGLDSLVKLIVMAEAFVLGSMIELKPVLIGFGLGMWVNSAVMLLGIDVPHTSDNAGLFVNSNAMGEIAGLVLVGCLFYREPICLKQY